MAIPVPRDLVAVVALAGVVAVVGSLEVRKHLTEANSPTISALEMDPDDLEALADFANQLKDQAHADEDMKAAVQEFNKLVEDLKNKRIDRNEAFRRMAELDNKLQKSGELDKKALEEAMKKVGSELKKNDLTKDVGNALEKGDKKEAEKKLKELAAKLKDKNLKLSDEQKKQLADAMKKAANRDREKSLAEMKAKRDKLQEELEKARANKEKNGGKETPEMEKDRKAKERELERLDREEKELASADRQLEKLDRDLESAAADIMKDLGLSAADLDAGAEDINKMAEDDLTAEEKEELRQRLKEQLVVLVEQPLLDAEVDERDRGTRDPGHPCGLAHAVAREEPDVGEARGRHAAPRDPHEDERAREEGLSLCRAQLLLPRSLELAAKEGPKRTEASSVRGRVQDVLRVGHRFDDLRRSRGRPPSSDPHRRPST